MLMLMPMENCATAMAGIEKSIPAKRTLLREQILKVFIYYRLSCAILRDASRALASEEPKKLATGPRNLPTTLSGKHPRVWSILVKRRCDLDSRNCSHPVWYRGGRHEAGNAAGGKDGLGIELNSPFSVSKPPCQRTHLDRARFHSHTHGGVAQFLGPVHGSESLTVGSQ